MISIVTLSFNQGRYLETALSSVVEQRTASVDVELVVVDPGSTDNSQSVIERYTDEIDHFVDTPDRGPAHGLNHGFAATSGEILGFLNADDWLEPGALERVQEHFRSKSKSRAVTGSLRVVFDGNRPHSRVVSPLPFTLKRFAEGRTLTLQQSTFFTRDAWQCVDGFNADNNACWDTELFLDMLVAGVEFDRIRPILASFRIHDASITGSGQLADSVSEHTLRLRERAQAAGGIRPKGTPAALRRLAWRGRPHRRLDDALRTLFD